MSSTWNAESYGAQARQGQADADQLPEGPKREAYLLLADGYADLAMLVETRELSGAGTLTAG